MTHRCRAAAIAAGSQAGVLTGCTDDPNLDELGSTLGKDARWIVQEAETLRPVSYEGTIAEITRDAETTVPCEEKGLQRHGAVVEGVSEYGAAGLPVTARTLSSLRGAGLCVGRDLEKVDGDILMRATVTRGRPNTRTVEGRTICADTG
jgi:hypothetical protein